MTKIAKNLANKGMPECCSVAAIGHDDPSAPLHARQLRTDLASFIARAANGSLRMVSPPPQTFWTMRGAGHLHLNAELFLQVQGYTEFRFPHGQVTLRAGEALVMPPKLLHDEWVGGADGLPFSNIVVHADHQSVSCHSANEARPGRPANLFLESFQHVEAPRIEAWLNDAAKPPADDAHGLWPLQQRALVLTALSSVARMLDTPQKTASSEPALLGRLRVAVQNRLGDPELTVASLAEEVGCTADYLSNLYSRSTGEHLWQVVLRQRLARAARLLSESDSAVKEVAWCCGFASASYFIRSFRQQFGVTPKAFRAQAQA
ncbi:AraC family transcriptional regulator [uncultured Rhodoferax sp.]|uniref:helix-turn-helix transcriptional regulator n=1 Tax=uncultured Rhodoferax sp. TaxID=223188 RepID=UPI0025DE685B|nr:AraC family transcriptional regulator [uncultured Rhodoferax sp.]